LPQSQNGALILRTGFPEMVNWLFRDKFDTTIVCSERSEVKPLRNPYAITYTKYMIGNCANSDSTIGPTVILRFTDSTLEILK
jgi:hypothetical protein